MLNRKRCLNLFYWFGSVFIFSCMYFFAQFVVIAKMREKSRIASEMRFRNLHGPRVAGWCCCWGTVGLIIRQLGCLQNWKQGIWVVSCNVWIVAIFELLWRRGKCLGLSGVCFLRELLFLIVNVQPKCSSNQINPLKLFRKNNLPNTHLALQPTINDSRKAPMRNFMKYKIYLLFGWACAWLARHK